MRGIWTAGRWCSLVAVIASLGCRADGPGAAGNPPSPPTKTPEEPAGPAPFAPLPPHVYGSKVKNLLTGLPLEDAELGKLTAAADAAPALQALIDGWMALPQFRDRMMDFFKHAFQQTQTDISDYDQQLGRPGNTWTPLDRIRFVRAAEESFARTALELVGAGRPFTEVLTTDRIMLNPPLMSSYAAIDAMPQTDLERPVQQAFWLRQKYPNLVFVRTTNLDAAGVPVPIPIEQSIDPASPNFMKWFDPQPYRGMNLDRCAEPQMRMGVQAYEQLADFLYGGRPGCGSTVSQFTPQDWDAWRMVTIRAPRPGEERTIFWDLPRLRDPRTDLVLAAPRVGFMTTLAFFANWPTNGSNSYRVTTNQALIVALGRSFDDRGTTVQVNETSVDNQHVKPDTACFGCHSTLDPMRDFFRQSFSIPYGIQLQPLGGPAIPPTATFTVDGSKPVTGTGIAAFAQALASHPRFAVAWTQKLCQFANAGACLDNDPELVRVAEAFRASNHDWKALVRTLFSSPLVTFAKETQTARESGVAIGISRRETLCAALEQRMGLGDFCSIRQATPGVRNVFVNTARNLALSIPGAGYARGDEAPLLPHDPSMFFSAASENLCDLLAGQLVDKPASRYRSSDRDGSIHDMVTTLVGLPPGDPRAADLKAILTDHHAEALKLGVNPAQALRSTFTLACESPLAVSVGL